MRVKSGSAIREQLEVFRHLAVDLVDEEELAQRLSRGRPLRVKLGCDPSAPDLHIGHSIPLDKLRSLAEWGHRIIFLVGDFTAMIGDPTGRRRTRPALDRAEIDRNAATYREQVSAILDPSAIEIRFNSEWMDVLSPADLIRLASQQPVARMLERDDFKRRFRSGETIGIHELLYPLVQAYDSVALRADVEIGGTDQLFNLLLGREIQRVYGQEPQIVLTLPLLEGTDGVEKMSKSLGNAVAFRDSPDEIYGKVMSVADAGLWRWIRLLRQPDWTDLPELASDLPPSEGNPRELKATLARRLVERFHGSEEAQAAEGRFDRLFRRREVPEDLEVVMIEAEDREGASVVEVLRSLGFAASSSEARRLVAQGGVRIDREREADAARRLGPGEYLIQAGKRRFARIQIRALSL